MNSKGQVTIFIIIGIVAIALVVLFFLFSTEIKSAFGFGSENPSEYLQNCIEDELLENLEMISLSGGTIEPEHYFTYDDQQVQYLCYTNEYYVPCIIQIPTLVNSVENSLKESISEKAEFCLDSLKKDFENKGYEATLNKKAISVELVPKKVELDFNSALTLKKNEIKTFESIKVEIPNNLYEILSIAQSILDYETTYGDAETTIYMDYYPNLKVEKKKQSEGTTIYIITDRKTEDKFMFASRSVAWPPGYASSGGNS